MKKIIFILLIINNIFLFSQNDEKNKVRIIILNKIGQKEKVNFNEKVSIVLGTNIKPEYSYINYISGKNSEDYYVELKSNEGYLKEISNLRNSIDSIKRNEITPKENKELLNHKSHNDSSHSIPFSQKAIYDTITKKKNENIDKNLLSKIPSIQNSINALNFIKNANSEALDKNLDEYNKNLLRIDTLNLEIEKTINTGKNKHLLNEFNKELEFLKARNKEIEDINNTLTTNNSILESELRANQAEAKFLRLALYTILAVIIFLIAFAIILYINYRQKKRFNIELENNNNILKALNFQLTKSNEEKAKLLRVINKELEFATDYVKSLLPSPLNNKIFKTDWLFIPSEELGGDAFGYNKIDDDNYAFYLLDVSGHGVGSALHSVQVLNILQNLALPNVNFCNPKDVLNNLNRIFQMNNYHGLYFTIFYAVYNSAKRSLKYASAGHPPMLLINNKSLQSLEAQHIFIGAVQNLEYSYDEIEVQKNSSLYLFSDGVFELEKIDKSMYSFRDFTQDFNNIIKEKNGDFKKFYDFAKSITGKERLNDDFSILEITFL